MDVLADLVGLGHQLYELRRHILGMRGHEPDALDAFYLVGRLQQVGEGFGSSEAWLLAVSVDVLTEQCHLSDSRPG